MTPANLCALLDDFEPLAMEIASLEREASEKEAAVLKAFFDRLVLLIPVLSEKCEAAYRRTLTVLTVHHKIPLCPENSSYFYSEERLILYENGILVRAYRTGIFSGGPLPGCEMAGKSEITADGVIAAFGFSAVVKGLIDLLSHAKAPAVLKGELESRLESLSGALEAIG